MENEIRADKREDGREVLGEIQLPQRKPRHGLPPCHEGDGGRENGHAENRRPRGWRRREDQRLVHDGENRQVQHGADQHAPCDGGDA